MWWIRLWSFLCSFDFSKKEISVVCPNFGEQQFGTWPTPKFFLPPQRCCILVLSHTKRIFFLIREDKPRTWDDLDAWCTTVPSIITLLLIWPTISMEIFKPFVESTFSKALVLRVDIHCGRINIYLTLKREFGSNSFFESGCRCICGFWVDLFGSHLSVFEL